MRTINNNNKWSGDPLASLLNTVCGGADDAAHRQIFYTSGQATRFNSSQNRADTMPKLPNLLCRNANVSRVPSSRAEADLLHIWRLGRAIIGLRLEAAAAVI